MSLSYEMRICWCRLATTGVFVVAAFVIIAPLLASGAIRAFELPIAARSLFTTFACLLSASLTLAAARLRDSVGGWDHMKGIEVKPDALKVRTRWAAFREKGGQLLLPADTLKRSTTEANSKHAGVRLSTRDELGKYDNSDLVRRAEADFLRLKRK